MYYVAIVLVLTVLWYTYIKFKYRGTEKIPGPKPFPILGNIMDLTNDNLGLLQNMLRLNRKHGSIFRLWLGPIDLNVIIADPVYVEYILTTKNAVEKSTWPVYFRDLVYEGVVISKGYKWPKQRKLIAPMFSSANVKKYIPSINIKMGEFVNILKGIKEYEQIDIAEYAFPCLMAAICQTMMYLSCSSMEIKEFTQAISNYFNIVLKRSCSVFLRNEFIFNLTSLAKQLKHNTNIVHNITDTFITRRINERLQQKVTAKNTFLDHLLDATEGIPTFSDITIRDEIICIIVAGYETTATAVSYCIYELSKRPDIQFKLLQEINDIVGDNEISYGDLLEMSYLDCVFKETLRMYPPIPMVDRVVEEPLAVGEHHFPKNTTYTFFIYGIHHNEAIYPEPEVFDPDRFLPENVQKRHSQSFIPFGAGTRNCLGMKYAIVQGKMMILDIVRNFEICVGEPNHRPILSAETTLKCLNGLPVRLRSRQ